MNRYLEKSGLQAFDKDLTLLKIIDERELGTDERLQLLEQVGNFSITPASLLKRIMKAQNIHYVKKTESSSAKTSENQSEASIKKEIII